MINYEYIKDLFIGILSQSTAIQGRFYISHRYGAQEINSDNLGQVLKAQDTIQKYPLVMMPAPHSMLKPSEQMGEWETFRLVTYWCKTSYRSGDGSIIDMNPKTATSQHSVYDDWHDMKRCALNFIRALCTVQRQTHPAKFRVPPNQMLCVPFSIVGTDNVSGVKLDFDFSLWLGCTVEDYSEYPKTILVTDDSHPEHEL